MNHNYYLDTEFIEGFSRTFPFGKKRHTIQLISIGMVSADGSAYEAISNEYNYKDASDWVKKNVIAPLYEKQAPAIKEIWSVANFQNRVGKSNCSIAREIMAFVYRPLLKQYSEIEMSAAAKWDYIFKDMKEKIDFYGYFADYDWVLFCSLFGKMINLPVGFPKFCIDLKQTMELFGYNKAWKELFHPEPENAHDAVADAKWIQELHKKIYVHAKIKINHLKF